MLYYAKQQSATQPSGFRVKFAVGVTNKCSSYMYINRPISISLLHIQCLGHIGCRAFHVSFPLKFVAPLLLEKKQPLPTTQ